MNKRVKQLIVTTPFAMGIIFAGQGAAFASPLMGPGPGSMVNSCVPRWATVSRTPTATTVTTELR
jgi:hypothetical protein